MQQLPKNTLLQGGKYKIEKILGQGGFGITYLATQELFDRKVCIKEFFFKDSCSRTSTGKVTLGTVGNKDLVERFLNKFIKEARTISKLEHPNIIRILDVFMENGTAYYVMDFIEGESLEGIVKRRGAMHEHEAIGYIKQVANALDYLHQHRINHLDVKPANIMVRKEDNKAILIDFGLSKQYDAQGGQTSTTPVGISHGYAPMEQYNVSGVSMFSPQTDIYSLGATLYKLLSGNTPPQASEVLNEGLPLLSNAVSIGTKNAIESAMQVKKKDRPENVKQFLSCLETQNLASKLRNINDETKLVEEERIEYISNEKSSSKGKMFGYVIALLIVITMVFVLKPNREEKSASDLPDHRMNSVELVTSNNTVKDELKEESEQLIVFKTEKHTINKSEGNFKYIVQMDYPVSGNENLTLNIKEWIVETLIGQYDGSLDNPNNILERGYMNAKKEWNPMFASETEIEYVNIYKTNNFITYENRFYGYEGGAHGFSSNIGVTFRNKDGRRFGWDMIVKDQTLKNLIVDGLKKQYFEVNSDEDFFNEVMLDDTPNRFNFPFPETAPWITSEGVVFQYKEYEIASYAQGKPYCVIPLSQVERYFTSSVKRMLE